MPGAVQGWHVYADHYLFDFRRTPMKIVDRGLQGVADTSVRHRWKHLMSSQFLMPILAIVLFIVWEIGSIRTTLVVYFGWMLPILILSICMLLPRKHAI